jgi:transcriptional regulator with XRE-family HTH domain
MIGSKLSELRKFNKMSLRSLSESTGISVTFLSDIEHGRGNPSIDNLKLIAKTFNVSPAFFIEDSLDSSIIIDDELLNLISDFKDWSNYDKQELISYLKAKKIIRSFDK